MTYQEIQETLAKYKQTIAAVKHLSTIKPPTKPSKKKWANVPPVKGRTTKYPWHGLAVNHSFLVPCADNPAARERVMNSLTSCIAVARKRYADEGREFCQRSDPKGVRVWRVK